MNPAGKVTAVGDNVRSNGILLSRDEKTLYVTSGGPSPHVQADGSTTNQRQLRPGRRRRRRHDGGLGRPPVCDRAGRRGLERRRQVSRLDRDAARHHQRRVWGPDKKTMGVVAAAVDAAGKDLRTPEGVRNNAKSLYKIQMISQGFAGRAK
jgi:hypothetical protein